jgi:ATP adenylyltransferase
VVADGRHVVWKGERAAVVLNAYPYTSGHVMVVPVRHVDELEELAAEESVEVWAAATDAVRALKIAYRAQGVNVGANLGAAAGAGLPGHLHVHVLPRWSGDTNFMTSVAETRVLPEALDVTLEKLRSAWPA